MTTTLPPRTTLAPPPVLPAIVYVVRHGDRDTVHAVERHGTVRTKTHAVRNAEPDWCNQCWPGRRCVFCRAPSGERGECASCSADSMRIEKRRDVVDGWDAA